MRIVIRRCCFNRQIAATLIGMVITFSSVTVLGQSSSPDDVVRRYNEINGRAQYIAAESARLRAEASARAKAQAGNQGSSVIDREFEKDLPDNIQINLSYARQQNYQASLEANVKYDWMQEATYQAGKALERAQKSPNQADRDYWLREAQSKLDQADRLTRMFVSPAEVPPSATDAPTGAAANRPGSGVEPAGSATGRPAGPGGAAGKDAPVDRYNAGLLKLRTFEIGDTQRRAAEADPQLIQQRAKESFGEGRAGAGGVSLHAAADIPEMPPKNEIRRATVSDGRLILELSGGGVLRFPPLDMDHLAVAVRSIYDAPVEGTLTADESNLIAVQTGKDQFGEIVWHKQLLPDPPPKVAVGEKGRWELGPGIGLLSDVAPSTNRVTYYGAVRGTRMGRILLEADGFLGICVTGLDWQTGKPVRLPAIEGLTTGPERLARRTIKEAEARARGETPPQKAVLKPDPKRWWLGTTWYVWVPDRFTLRRANNELEFAEARMKLTTWSADEADLKEDERRLAAAATEHYDELALAYPVLKELVEVTKVTSIVRRLRRDGIELDRAWERDYRPTVAETPATIRRYGFYLAFDIQGRVLLEPAKQEVRP